MKRDSGFDITTHPAARIVEFNRHQGDDGCTAVQGQPERRTSLRSRSTRRHMTPARARSRALLFPAVHAWGVAAKLLGFRDAGSLAVPVRRVWDEESARLVRPRARSPSVQGRRPSGNCRSGVGGRSRQSASTVGSALSRDRQLPLDGRRPSNQQTRARGRTRRARTPHPTLFSQGQRGYPRAEGLKASPRRPT